MTRRARWDIAWIVLSTLSARAGLDPLAWMDMRADEWVRLTTRTS